MPQIFNIEEEVSQYIAAFSAGDAPEIPLPEYFPDDPQWQLWPKKLYSGIFAPGCPVDPVESAQRISAVLSGPTEVLTDMVLLPHLKHRLRSSKRKPPGRKNPKLHILYTLLQEEQSLSPNSADRFIETATNQDELKEYFDPDYAADYIFFETRGYYRNFLGDSGIREEQRYLDTPELYKQACLMPLVQNYLGAAALLGLLEILYDSSGSPYTPWEGISKFKPTAWGEFVMGTSKEAPVWKPRRVLEFSDGGEIVSLRGSSPKAQQLLNNMGSEIAPGVFRLGRGQILSSAATEHELHETIDQLKAMAQDPLPPFWQELFDSLDTGLVRLKEASEYLVFHVPDHKIFRLLLREDPALSRLVIPVAGRKILVKRCDLSRLQKEIQKRGLLLEIQQ